MGASLIFTPGQAYWASPESLSGRQKQIMPLDLLGTVKSRSHQVMVLRNRIKPPQQGNWQCHTWGEKGSCQAF